MVASAHYSTRGNLEIVSPLRSYIEEFASDLRLGGRTSGTIRKHVLELRRLDKWMMSEGLHLSDLTRKHLKTYTRRKADLGFSARSNMFCTLRVFFDWTTEEGYTEASPAAGFKTPIKPQPLPRALTSDQIRRLIDYLASNDHTLARRDEAIILTALYAGLRAAELGSLLWSDIDIAGQCINIELSKMQHGRSIALHPTLKRVLLAWREIAPSDKYVFSLTNRPMISNSIGKVCRRISKCSGVRFTTHQLRHTFATHMLRQSRDLYSVSKALGHKQLIQTQIYLTADVEDMRVSLNKLPDISEWGG